MQSEPSSNNVQVIGRYAVYDAIAAGGMATVYYGRLLGPVGFSRTVAIKRLHTQFARDPEFVSMFLDEARLAARIRHPNVVPTLDVVATDGELFLVMEYVPGESLAKLVRAAATQGTIVPPRIVVATICGVLRGLHAAHEATNERGEPLGIVHRDVSPQNILVGIDGQARVLDFGVAKAAGRLQTTRDGKLKGKLAYMAPEQLRGKPVDRRVDVFAASTVLWEALTGRRLFRGDNEGAIITKILDGNVEAPSTVLPLGELGRLDDATLATLRAVDAIVLKGLATDPSDRYATAREMASALERAVPPAGFSEVSDWVEHFAKDILVSRAQQVAEIESSSTSAAPSSLGSLPARVLESDESLPTVSRVGSAISQTGRGSSPSVRSLDEPRGAIPDLSTISVASQSTPSEKPALRWKRGAGFALLFGLAAIGLVAVVRTVRPTATAAASSDPSAGIATVFTTPSAAVSGSSPPSALAPGLASAHAESPVPSSPPTGEATAPSGDATRSSSDLATNPFSTAKSGRASASPVGVTSGRPPPLPHAPQTSAAAAAPPAAASPPHSTSSCSPPFTYDAQGLKHFKPECL